MKKWEEAAEGICVVGGGGRMGIERAQGPGEETQAYVSFTVAEVDQKKFR